jgi:hypothetical protein
MSRLALGWPPKITENYCVVEVKILWERIKQDREEYVFTFLICQQDKIDTRMRTRLLQPLPILERHWMGVSMDFII